MDLPRFPRDCTIIHNHPRGTPISAQDFASFHANDAQAIIAAIRQPDGKIGKFVLTRKKEGDILKLAEIQTRYNNAITKKNKYF